MNYLHYIALAVVVLVILWTLVSASRSDHPFDVRDILMDAATGKASLNAVILLVMTTLSAWVVVVRVHADDVNTLLLGVLGIFVVGRVGSQGISAWKPPVQGNSNEPGRTETGIKPS